MCVCVCVCAYSMCVPKSPKQPSSPLPKPKKSPGLRRKSSDSNDSPKSFIRFGLKRSSSNSRKKGLSSKEGSVEDVNMEEPQSETSSVASMNMLKETEEPMGASPLLHDQSYHSPEKKKEKEEVKPAAAPTPSPARVHELSASSHGRKQRDSAIFKEVQMPSLFSGDESALFGQGELFDLLGKPEEKKGKGGETQLSQAAHTMY